MSKYDDEPSERKQKLEC